MVFALVAIVVLNILLTVISREEEPEQLSPTRCTGFAIVPRLVEPKLPFCVVTRVFNYAEWIPEWIEYYAALGTSRFWIVNDCSNDTGATTGVLEYYARNTDFVEYLESVPGQDCSPTRAPNEKHLVYYATTLAKEAGCEWISVLDVDEFVTFWGEEWQKVESIVPILRHYPMPMVKMAWWTAGHHKQETKAKGLQLENHNLGTVQRPCNAKTIARADIIKEWRRTESPVVIYDCLADMAWELCPEPDQVLNVTNEKGETSVVTNSPILLKHFMYRSWEEYKRGRGSLNLTSDNGPNMWIENPRGRWERGHFPGTFDPSAEFTARMITKVRASLSKRLKEMPDFLHKMVLD